MVSLGITYIKGSDAFAFTFAFPDMLAVLSGVFYPITLFPVPLQYFVSIFPTTHAFAILKGGKNILPFLITALIWFILAAGFNTWAFNKARREGKLVKLK